MSALRRLPEHHLSFLARKSAMAALIASSAGWSSNLTGGSSATGDLDIANGLGFVDGSTFDHCGHQ